MLESIGTFVQTSAGETLSVVGTGKGPTVTKYVEPEYPAEARSRNLAGFVNLEVLVASTSRVLSANVIRSAGNGFDEAAAAAVKQWVFKPPVRKGRPLPVLFQMTINFKAPQ